MSLTGKCLYCYQPLQDSGTDFHPACARKMFGSTQPPVLDFDIHQIEELASQIVVRSVAVTGVQPKLSLQLEKRTHETPRLTIVGLHGDYILKPPSAEYAGLPENEDLTMHLAELAGISTARHTLIRLRSGELAYLTKRFDREKGRKIAVEDFCQLSENLTEHKYRGSVEKIGKLTHQFTANKGYELQRLFELVLYCYLTGNADMHLKNYALIRNPSGTYELSPAYDLVNTALVIPDDKEESALTINGRKNNIRKRDFDALAQSFGIHEKPLSAIYRRFQQILPIWTGHIRQSFLSETIQEDYIRIVTEKHRILFPA